MPVSEKLMSLVPDPGLVLIAGGIRSGKSCLGYGILEAIHAREPERALYSFYFPGEKEGLLPEWIVPIEDENFPEGSAVIADEAYIPFYSKEHTSASNKFMDKFSGLAGQKNILAIFVPQTTRKLSLSTV